MKKKPYLKQGLELKTARGGRPRSAVVDALQLKNEQTVQNWEAGFNRPDPSKWAKLTEFLGIDIARLYTGAPSAAKQPTVRIDAILPILATIEQQLSILRLLCGTQNNVHSGQFAPRKTIEKMRSRAHGNGRQFERRRSDRAAS